MNRIWTVRKRKQESPTLALNLLDDGNRTRWIRRAAAKQPADQLAASLRSWEQGKRTLRLVEATKDQLGVVYSELERVVQHLAEERARLEELLRSRAGQVTGGD